MNAVKVHRNKLVTDTSHFRLRVRNINKRTNVPSSAVSPVIVTDRVVAKLRAVVDHGADPFRGTIVDIARVRNNGS